MAFSEIFLDIYKEERMQSRMISILSSTIMVLSLLLLAACGGGSTSTSGTSTATSGKNPADIHVGFVTETSSENFASEMAAGAQYAANQ